MSIRPGQAKGAYTGTVDAGGDVTDVTATTPLVSSGGTAPNISIAGLSGFGLAGQYPAMNAMGTALEWVTPNPGGGVTGVTANAPITSTGGATPIIGIGGLTTLGTALQLMGVNAAATALEWVSSTGTGSILRATALTAGAGALNWVCGGRLHVETGATTPPPTGTLLEVWGAGGNETSSGTVITGTYIDVYAASGSKTYVTALQASAGTNTVSDAVASMDVGYFYPYDGGSGVAITGDMNILVLDGSLAPAVNGVATALHIVAPTTGMGGNFAIYTSGGGAVSLDGPIGFFGAPPVSQQVLTTQVVPNPATDTANFLLFAQSLTDGLLAYGLFQ